MLTKDLSAQKRKHFISIVKKRAKRGSGSSLNFLYQRTWANPVANLKAIIRQAPFVVVRDVATRLYMPERMTLDLDILVKTEDADLIYKDLRIAGSRKIGDLGILGSQWELVDQTSLDVLEGEDEWVKDAVCKADLA